MFGGGGRASKGRLTGSGSGDALDGAGSGTGSGAGSGRAASGSGSRAASGAGSGTEMDGQPQVSKRRVVVQNSKSAKIRNTGSLSERVNQDKRSVD